MEIQKKMEALLAENKSVIAKRNQAQDILNIYTSRLLEIQGAVKILEELKKDEEKKDKPESK